VSLPVSSRPRGGGAVGEVVAERTGGSVWVQKHVGRIRYEDIRIARGAEMAPTFYDWIRSTLGGKPLRKSGAVIAVDYEGKELKRLQFFNALISEVVLPELKTSKAPARILVRLAPETTRWLEGGRPVVGTHKSWTSSKPLLASNFQIQIVGLDCAGVNKIAPLAIKTGAGESSIEAGNLTITMRENGSKSFRDWHENFVVRGNSTPDNEKSGSIQLLFP
jgi:T4-like virus tail tube protein gp19